MPNINNVILNQYQDYYMFSLDQYKNTPEEMLHKLIYKGSDKSLKYSRSSINTAGDYDLFWSLYIEIQDEDIRKINGTEEEQFQMSLIYNTDVFNYIQVLHNAYKEYFLHRSISV